jgi:hypothetical protein
MAELEIWHQQAMELDDLLASLPNLRESTVVTERQAAAEVVALLEDQVAAAVAAADLG